MFTKAADKDAPSRYRPAALVERRLMMILIFVCGMGLGIMIACIIAVILCDKPDDQIKKPMLDAELTPAQAVFKLQEIKPYYAYKGRTWTALDMAIKALQEETDETI